MTLPAWFDPRLWLVGLLVAGTGVASWSARGWLEDSRRLAEQHQASKEAFRRGELVDANAAGHEATRARLSGQKAAIDKELDRVAQTPAARAECLDADGLRILSSAIDGTDPGEPAPAVRAPDEAGRRQPPGGAALGDEDGAGLPGVR